MRGRGRGGGGGHILTMDRQEWENLRLLLRKKTERKQSEGALPDRWREAGYTQRSPATHKDRHV